MWHSFLRKIAATISQFFAAAAKPREFQLWADVLAFVGYPWRGRKRPHAMRQSTARMWRCRLQNPFPGGLATLVLPTMVGKLAYVRKVCGTLDWSAVFASIDMYPFFRGPRLAIARQCLARHTHS